MPTCTMEFHRSEAETFHSKGDLAKALSSMKEKLAERNPIIFLTHENGNILSFAISLEGYFVNYKDASWDPPYYSSAGDPEFAEETGVVDFFLDGHHTEIRKRQLIKFPDLVAVVLHFFEHGTHPAELIDWVED
jgi:hypothetical protein